MRLFVALAMAALSGCATLSSEDPAVETISIEAGPCFGFCPVYRLELKSDNTAEFTGIRHTRLIGAATRKVTEVQGNRLRYALASYRPATNREFECSRSRTDATQFTITWDSGAEKRTLLFDSGCADAAALILTEILHSTPGELGFEKESEQITREGVSRG